MSLYSKFQTEVSYYKCHITIAVYNHAAALYC
jgi:hypothetical protein